MEVSRGVWTLIHHKNTGVNWGIWVWTVEDVEVNLHATSTLISTDLYPDFITGYEVVCDKSPQSIKGTL